MNCCSRKCKDRCAENSKGVSRCDYRFNVQCRHQCQSNLSFQFSQSNPPLNEVVPFQLSQCALSKGEEVKKLYDVVQRRVRTRKSQPNLACRVEAFGKVCEQFDDRRRRWVREMRFGGLLHLVGVSLPRTLCYWLLTRVNPLKETILLNDGHEYALTKNQIRWVLGIPLGGKVIPRKTLDEDMKVKQKSILCKYGMRRHGVIKATGKEIHSNGVTLSDATLDRLKGEWSEEEDEEFKTSFLLMSLYLVLCPTQCFFGGRFDTGAYVSLQCTRV